MTGQGNGFQATQPPDPQQPKFSRRGRAPTPNTGHVTADEFDEAMEGVLQRLDDLYAAQEDMPKLMAAAVADGIRAAAKDRDVSSAIMDNLGDVAAERAVRATGRGLWKAVAAAWRNVGMLLLAVVLIAGALGIGPAVTFVKWAAAVVGGKS